MAVHEGERAGQRILRWENCLNARDLGGYRTVTGRTTRWGAFARCDNPARLTNTGEAAVLDHGITTVIDLRKADEVAEHPNPLRLLDGRIHYHNISLIDPAAVRGEFTVIAEEYIDSLRRFSGRFAEVMRAMASAPTGGVLIQCMGGKDRTGLIAALLLALAGVPADVIAADYALSEERLRPLDEEWLANGPGTREDREHRLALWAPRAGVMLDVLERLENLYGGAESYLLASGLKPGEVDGILQRIGVLPLPECPTEGL